jgi:hypothetical protein
MIVTVALSQHSAAIGLRMTMGKTAHPCSSMFWIFHMQLFAKSLHSDTLDGRAGTAW